MLYTHSCISADNLYAKVYEILVFILVSGAPSVLLNINDTILFHKYFVLTCQRKSRFCAVIKMLKKMYPL